MGEKGIKTSHYHEEKSELFDQGVRGYPLNFYNFLRGSPLNFEKVGVCLRVSAASVTPVAPSATRAQRGQSCCNPGAQPPLFQNLGGVPKNIVKI